MTENTPESTNEWPDLERAEITFLINVEGVTDLAEALDVAAINLLRHGMDNFHILATDPDTDRQWIIHNGEVSEAQEAADELERMMREEDEDVAPPAENDLPMAKVSPNGDRQD